MLRVLMQKVDIMQEQKKITQKKEWNLRKDKKRKAR